MQQYERQEQKLLYQAIRNSLVETKNTNENLSSIDQMPVYYPTEEEFKNPMDYIDKLYKSGDGSKYGCLKIIPPSSFKP